MVTVDGNLRFVMALCTWSQLYTALAASNGQKQLWWPLSLSYVVAADWLTPLFLIWKQLCRKCVCVRVHVWGGGNWNWHATGLLDELSPNHMDVFTWLLDMKWITWGWNAPLWLVKLCNHYESIQFQSHSQTTLAGFGSETGNNLERCQLLAWQ